MQSLIEIRRRIEAGSLTPQAAIEASLEAIRAADGAIRAFVHVDEGAGPGTEGPLQGIAVGVKDIVDVAGQPTGMGSPIYDGWHPRADAPVTSLLRRAGATPLAKTSTTAFAYLDPTPTRNPRNPGHSPGGSSSGSAAAVAAGMVPLAIGTQTGGSVIRPASYCGVAAIKPSYRMLPTVGVKCFSWSLDTVGLFAASTADVAFALAAITGRGELLPEGEPGLPRIGVVIQDFAGEPDPSMAAALERAAELAAAAGARVSRATLPPILAAAFTAHGTIQDFEVSQALAFEYDLHRDALPPLLREMLEGASAVGPGAYDAARSTANRARSALRDVFLDADVLLTVSAPGPAPETLASTGSSAFNRLWTLMGTPCVNVPGLVDPRGLPLGIQVVAPFGADALALSAARFLETALREG
jgi:Asp-tRNA(Asn)/Glu-tRNA(Gln) amidotransferase A subunit family amidase